MRGRDDGEGMREVGGLHLTICDPEADEFMHGPASCGLVVEKLRVIQYTTLPAAH